LDEFVVMPNHIHGIIEIAKTNDERENITGRDDVLKCNDVTGCGNVETQYFASLQSSNLAFIIRGYKNGEMFHLAFLQILIILKRSRLNSTAENAEKHRNYWACLADH